MIALIAGWLVKRSLAKGGALALPYAKRMVKFGLIALAVVLVIAGLFVWDWLDDRAAIKAHEAERVEQALEAERRATANDLGRRDAAEAQSQATTRELETIHAEDPQAAAAPAAPGSRAVARRLPAQ